MIPRTLLASLASILALQACATVAGTGRRQLLLLSQAEEHQMGLEAWGQIKSKEKVSEDAAATALVQKVGKRLAAAVNDPSFQWEFVVFDSEQANAFCLPGGKIAVYSGILPITKDEDGLAVVMGHEIAHATARHGGERLSQGLVAELGAAAVAKGLGSKDPTTTKAVYAALGIGVGVGVLLPYSRTHESEADRIGLTTMAKAGYHPRHAIQFWERMAKKGGGDGIEMLSSHPSHSTRIQQIRGWIPEALRHYKKQE